MKRKFKYKVNSKEMQRTSQPSMFYGAKRGIFQNAEHLRQKMTEAEELLWQRLCKSQLGVRFKAQHPIDIFIADFYCHKYKIIIELDGEIHDYQFDYDNGRTAELEQMGLTVIRFRNQEVIENIEHVLNTIKTTILDKEKVYNNSAPNP